ncbi:MAG TPA: amino acid-binding protein [Candidatus Mailhella merdavium]|nr:amino acid-binding protein [Candidatus Mailhella merdavium]
MVSEFASILHELVLDNPVPAKDLAKSIGKPYSTLLREVNPYDTGAKLGAETLLQIMTQTGDLKPLEFMANSLGYELSPRKEEKNAKASKNA